MLRWPDVSWHRRPSCQQVIFLGVIIFGLLISGLLVWAKLYKNQPGPSGKVVGTLHPVKKTLPNAAPPKISRPAPLPSTKAPLPAQTSQPFIFGVGAELDKDINYQIVKDAPIRLLSSWYSGPIDFNFMDTWQGSLVTKAYASGYSLHLIIYSNDPEQNLDTAYGPACGRPYPLSPGFLDDVRHLAQIFNGGKLYVSMFTELQTYPCNDNAWVGSENYYRALKDQYLAAMNIFHQTVSGSLVSLSWGGWLTNWDDQSHGGGRSLLKYFADVMNASDFQSFQAMATDSNLAIVSAMTKALQPYNGGVMVAHYKPDNGSQSTFNSDMRDIFTSSNMAALQQNDLFAFSFMDTNNLHSSETAYQAVKLAIQTYAH